MKDKRGHGSAAHQAGVYGIARNMAAAIAEHAKRFAKSESGAGKQMFHNRPDDPDTYSNAVESAVGSSHGFDPSVMAHYTHFLHFIAWCAVADVLVQGVAWFFDIRIS